MQLFENNAWGTLAATITDAAVSLTLTAGQGARFPSPTGEDYFLLTLIDLDGGGAEFAWEIVKVTARSTDTLTIVRAQDGTTAIGWNSGTRCEMRVTQGTLENLVQDDELVIPVNAIAYATDLAGQAVRTLTGNLTAIAALTPTDSHLIVGNGTTFVAETGATARASLGLGDSATKNVGTAAGTVAAGDSLVTETDNRVLYDEELARAVTYATDIAGQAATTLSGSVPSAVPASATAPGVAGQLRYASGFLYVCVASNVWQRVALATWS
jgi:hypothetical protein